MVKGGRRAGVGFLASSRLGCIIHVQMAARLALRKRGKRTGKRLAEVYAAGLFLYGREDIGIKMDDLFDEPLAVNIAQLRERRERVLAVYHANRETVRTGLRSGREGQRKE